MHAAPVAAGSVPSVGSDELDRLLADLRLLADGIQEANANWSGEGADLERIAASLQEHLDSLPARIASAMADALSKQHQMIMTDVHAALREFGARAESSTAPAKPSADLNQASKSAVPTVD